jgi:hypothetical protein
VLAVLGVLLVAWLPTIVSIVPWEGPVSRFVSGMFPGELTLRGFSVGWWRPLVIEEIRLHNPATAEADGRDFLVVRGVRLTDGLWPLAVGPDRLGTMRVESVSVHVVRGADGAMNLAAYIPPSSGAPPPPKPPPPPAEPFALDLRRLIPVFPVPTQGLDFKLGRLDVTFEDRATTAPMRWTVEALSMHAHWPGGAAPLQIETAGTVTSTSGTMPLAGALEWINWTDGAQTTIGNSRLAGRLRLFAPADAPDEAPASTLHLDLADGAADFSLVLMLDQLARAGQLAVSPAVLPSVDGTVRLEARLGAPDTAGRFDVDARVYLDGVTVPGYGAADAPVCVPNWEFKAAGRLHNQTFLPSSASADLTTSFAMFALRAEETDPGQHTQARMALDLDLTGADAFLHTTRFGVLSPARVRGAVRLGGTFDIEQMRDAAGNLRLDLALEQVTLKDTGLLPPAAAPRDATIDLRPVALSIALDEVTWRGGDFAVVYTVEGDLLRLGGRVARPATGATTVGANLAVPLQALSDYLNGEFQLQPAITFGGAMALAADATLDGPALQAEVGLMLEGLHASAAMLPGGSYADNVSLTAKVAMPTMGNGTADVVLASDLAQVTARIALAGNLPTAIDSVVVARLDPLRDRVAVHYMPPGMIHFTGNVRVDSRVELPNLQTFDVRARVRGDDDFRVDFLPEELQFSGIAADADLRASLTPAGPVVDLRDSRVQLGAAADLRTTGTVAMVPAGFEFALTHVLEADVAELLAVIDPSLSRRGFALTDTAGRANISATLAGLYGRIDPNDTEIAYVVDSQLRLDSLTFGMTGMSIQLTDLSDDRHINGRLWMPATGAEVALAERGTLAIGSLSYNDMVAIEGLAATTATTVDRQRRVTLAVQDTGFQYLMAEAAGMVIELPPHALATRLVYTNAPAGLVVEELTASGDGLFELALDTSVALTDKATRLNLDLSLPDLKAIAEMLGDKVPVDLAGSSRTRLKLALTPETTPGATLPIRDYDINLATEWNNLRVDAGAAVVEGLTGSFTTSFTPDALDLGVYTVADVTITSSPLGQIATPFLFRTAVQASRPGREPIQDRLRLRLDDFTVGLAGLGTDFQMTAELTDIDVVAARATPPMQLVSDLGYAAFFELRQDLNALSLLPDAAGSSGSALVRFNLRNYPDDILDLEFEHFLASDLIRWGQMLRVEGLNGDIPLDKWYSHKPLGQDDSPPGVGTYGFERVGIVFPPYDVELRAGRFQFREARGLYTFTGRMQSLLGGPAALNLRLAREGDDPVFSGDFSLTGLDGAVLWPEVADRPRPQRELDAFGNWRAVFRRDSTVEGLLEDFAFRLDVSRIGPDLLRGALLSFNRQGGSPGIAAALVALRFGAPVSIAVELRGGLLSVAIEMASPGGIRYTIPVFERLGIGEVVSEKAPRNAPTQLRLLRNLMLAILAETVPEIESRLLSGAAQGGSNDE